MVPFCMWDWSSPHIMATEWRCASTDVQNIVQCCFFRITGHNFQFACLDLNFRGKYCNATVFITAKDVLGFIWTFLTYLTHSLSFITDPILRSDLLIIIGRNFPSGSLTVSHIHCGKIRCLDHISVLQNERKGSCHIISTLTSSSMYFLLLILHFYFFYSQEIKHEGQNLVREIKQR